MSLKDIKIPFHYSSCYLFEKSPGSFQSRSDWSAESRENTAVPLVLTKKCARWRVGMKRMNELLRASLQVFFFAVNE